MPNNILGTLTCIQYTVYICSICDYLSQSGNWKPEWGTNREEHDPICFSEFHPSAIIMQAISSQFSISYFHPLYFLTLYILFLDRLLNSLSKEIQWLQRALSTWLFSSATLLDLQDWLPKVPLCRCDSIYISNDLIFVRFYLEWWFGI